VCEGVIRAAYRDDRGCSPLTPGVLYALHVDLGPTSIVFQPGHRLRLDVSSSSYPHYAPSATAAHQTICHTSRYPSHLLLPIIPRGGRAG
jgi:predicted acyl esterase